MDPAPFLPSWWERLTQRGPLVLTLHILIVTSFSVVLWLSVLLARRKSFRVSSSGLFVLSFIPMIIATIGAWSGFRQVRLTVDVDPTDYLTRYGVAMIIREVDSALFFLCSGWLFTSAALICVYFASKQKIA